jgi:hypothetical protein
MPQPPQHASQRADMPEGTQRILNTRTLPNAHPRLAELLTPGLRMLDIGCGTTRSPSACIWSVLKGCDETRHQILPNQDTCQMRSIFKKKFFAQHVPNCYDGGTH